MSKITDVEEIETLLKNVEFTIGVIREALNRIRWGKNE